METIPWGITSTLHREQSIIEMNVRLQGYLLKLHLFITKCAVFFLYAEENSGKITFKTQKKKNFIDEKM